MQCLDGTFFPPSSPQCREYVSQYSSLVVEQLMNMVRGQILLSLLSAYLKPVTFGGVQNLT